jgi:hypothetical protein
VNKWYKLILQEPHVKEIGKGILSVSDKGEADFFSDDTAGAKVLACMKRVRIEWAAANGIMISGFESEGFNKIGKEKFKFQRWWLIYTE